MEVQGGYSRLFLTYFGLFWGYFGPLGTHQTILSYSLPYHKKATALQEKCHAACCAPSASLPRNDNEQNMFLFTVSGGRGSFIVSLRMYANKNANETRVKAF